MKPNVAIVRGKFLNAYEMQFFEPLIDSFDITAFGSNTSYHTTFTFPTVTLPSPMDWPQFPYSLSLYNRLFTDAQYLFGLEERLKGFALVHTAETYYRYTQQCLDAKAKGYVSKVVATVLENIPFNNEGISGRQTFKARARKELDHIIALTERTKAALMLEGASEDKISVIPHFIDTKRFYPNKKKEYSANNITLLFCGRLERYKGVYDVLRATALLIHDRDLSCSIQVVFAGDGSQKKQMKEESRRLGISERVKFLHANYREMPQIYHGADIFLAPSTSNGTWLEQYNTTLLEAQASGLPIVTTYSGGIPENVGDAAVLIPPEDPYALYNAIKAYILQPTKREAYANKARQRAVAVHDIHIGAKKIEAVWEKVLRDPTYR